MWPWARTGRGGASIDRHIAERHPEGIHSAKEWIYPPAAGVKLIVDTVEFTAKHVPKYNPISISGYHIREAGATALQELAFTIADGMAWRHASHAVSILMFCPGFRFLEFTYRLFEETPSFGRPGACGRA
jgi:methylmalonyl-CoA mutase N-terminal domain/subunit